MWREVWEKHNCKSQAITEGVSSVAAQLTQESTVDYSGLPTTQEPPLTGHSSADFTTPTPTMEHLAAAQKEVVDSVDFCKPVHTEYAAAHTADSPSPLFEFGEPLAAAQTELVGSVAPLSHQST